MAQPKHAGQPRLPAVLSVLCAAGMLLTATPVRVRSEGLSGAHGAPPAVAKWLPSRGRECNGKGKYRNFCQGPRKVPAPHGEAAALAKRLGLGSRRALSHLLIKPPKPEWVRAAGGNPDGDALRTPHLLWPVRNGKLWRGFGRVRRGPKRQKQHKGIDVGAPEGTPIVAADGGLVAYANNEARGYGNLLAIVHADGTVASYAHCKTIYVFPGQRVKRGQRVADVGHTGIARGSHLHFEYRRRGRPRDPIRLFEDAPERASARRTERDSARRTERDSARRTGRASARKRAR